jgi:hypothetical protein
MFHCYLNFEARHISPNLALNAVDLTSKATKTLGLFKLLSVEIFPEKK